MKLSLLGYRTAKERNLFLLCWVAYFSTYICRLNYSAVMPELSALGVYTEAQIASVSSCFFICYGVGQFINGVLGDKIEPRRMVFFGLLISGACNLILFPLHGFPLLLTLWGVNGFVQSMVWSPILRVAGDYYDEARKSKFGVDISTTVPLGTLASYGLSLLTLLLLPWNAVFLTCGAVVVLVAFLWYFGTGRTLKGMPKSAPAKGALAEPHVKALPMGRLISLFFSAGLLILLLPIAIHGALKDSVTQWVPTFMHQQFRTSTSLSLILTMVLPIINVTGAYFAQALNRKLKNEVATAMSFFTIGLLFLSVLFFWGKSSLVLTMVCLAGVTNCMFAVNVMTITLIPLHFSRYGRTSTMSGALNSIAYIGCGIANFGTGYLLEKYDWNATILLWLGIAAAAVLLSLVCLPLWKKFVQGEKAHNI